MIWYLVRFQQWNKVMWVTHEPGSKYWRTIRSNFVTRDPDDMILGIVVTEDTKDLLIHREDILRRIAA